uniref:Uncharacterized protein n=1 Tax=Anguilla anguilla TaxID=7936 RepID=A0A0E9X757_ANGAN
MLQTKAQNSKAALSKCPGTNPRFHLYLLNRRRKNQRKRSRKAPYCFQRKRRKMMMKRMKMRAVHGEDERTVKLILFCEKDC